MWSSERGMAEVALNGTSGATCRRKWHTRSPDRRDGCDGTCRMLSTCCAMRTRQDFPHAADTYRMCALELPWRTATSKVQESLAASGFEPF
jgi:hypothetical protein